jgi:AcrR family transcriptional regulator
MTTRAYDSPLRAEQAERTRDRILEAFAEQLAEARDDFSIPRVAERAGVSTRTVYHHFPNREAQIEALAAWIEKRAGETDPLPARPEELAGYVADRWARFLANQPILRAQLAPGLATHVRARRRKRREMAIDECVAATGVSHEDTRVASALIKHLIGAHAGVQLLDTYGLDGDESLSVVQWAIELMVRALRRGDGPRRRARRGDSGTSARSGTDK